jgi:heme-degrading monooxygenase HmoA
VQIVNIFQKSAEICSRLSGVRTELIGPCRTGVGSRRQSTTTRGGFVYARASTLRIAPEQVQAAIDHYEAGIPSLREIAGNRGTLLLVDRSSGEGIGVTLWESEAAMQASRRSAGELPQQSDQEPRAAFGSIVEYEVAVWAVS